MFSCFIPTVTITAIVLNSVDRSDATPLPLSR